MLMKVFERYFSRNPVSRQLSFEADTAVIVIIPVFNDPDIFATLDSLCCCSVMNIKAGVLIVVNHSEVCPQEIKTRNIGLSDTLKRYVRDRQTDRLRFEVVEAFDLPAKYAGVGLARKIAMDLSAAFFYRNGRIDAPILSLDADTWVEPNYLEEVVRYFQEKSVAGVSIAYAHRLEEADMTVQAREAIMKYELYLRYYRLALEYTGHPHAYHCIGSAFAVRTLDYVAQGGMNKRQAGEDFYFLQKLIATGRYATLQSTQVYPSPRFSGRTPFGTGQAVRQKHRDKGCQQGRRGSKIHFTPDRSSGCPGVNRFLSHAEQNQDDDKYQLYCQRNAAPFHILLIGVQNLAVPIQKECGVLPEEYRVQKHARADAQHEGYNGQHLGYSQGHEDGKDDNADGYHCARPNQAGKYGSRNNA